MNYFELLKQTETAFEEAGIRDPKTDAWELLSLAFHLRRKDYLLVMKEEAPAEEKKRFDELVNRRLQRIPLQHIIGRAGFMGLVFFVNEDVLCPRQDTELLAEEAIARLRPGMKLLDLCTGSGCLLVTLLKYSEGTAGVGADISKRALSVARRNAAQYIFDDRRIRFVHGDLFEPLRGETFSMIVCNPPYIPTAVIEGLMPEVRDHEPRTALDGSADGLAYYRRIAKEAPAFLEEGGLLLLEIGVDQRADVTALLAAEGFSDIVCKKDYAGNDRTIIATYQQTDE